MEKTDVGNETICTELIKLSLLFELFANIPKV
jgi:hypothetical protein